MTVRCIFGLIMVCACLGQLKADDLPKSPPPPENSPPGESHSVRESVHRALKIIDVVMAKHIDPPARQQMFLQLVKELYRKTNNSVPNGLSRPVSTMVTNEDFLAALEKSKPLAKRLDQQFGKKQSAELINSVLSVVPGNPRLISSNAAKVERQLDGNRYVGIGIALSYDSKTGYPVVGGVFPNGPANRSGLKKGDLILEADGIKTHKMSLQDFLPLARGDEGSTFTVVVRQPNSKEQRTIKMTRSAIERDTVRSIDINAGDIGYVIIDEIGGSTVTELRELEKTFRSRGYRGLIVDLTSVRRANIHYGVLLADALLDSGTIGRVRRLAEPTVYHANRDSMFGGFQIAVLVNRSTGGVPEWVAAALQDNKRAVIVGSPTAGIGFVNEPVVITNSDDALVLATAIMERADGRPIQRAVPQRQTNALPRAQPNTPFPTGAPPKLLGGVEPDELVESQQAQLARPGQPVPRGDALKTAIKILTKRLEQQRESQTSKDQSASQRESEQSE